jgi:Tol biopolymer transport system component
MTPDFFFTAAAYVLGVRRFLLAFALLAAVLVQTGGAGGGESDSTWLTFNEVSLDGKKRVLSRHDVPVLTLGLSPDRRQFAYVPSVRGGGSNQLWIADVRSPRERLIFEAPSWIRDVEWAPDGRTIAFSVLGAPSPPSGANGIWIIESDGTSPKRVADPGLRLRWSPDSRKLAFMRWPPTGITAVVSIDSKLTRDIAESAAFEWSPDGKSIVYETEPDGRPRLPRIRVVELRSGRHRRVALGRTPSWSPDGRSIAFIRGGQETRNALGITSARGGRARFLMSDAERPLWSPDSRWIAVTQGAGSCPSKVTVVRAAGGRPRKLATHAHRLVAPLAWGSRSRKVVYATWLC